MVGGGGCLLGVVVVSAFFGTVVMCRFSLRPTVDGGKRAERREGG